ncbi:MAG: hypothetical protein M3Q19_07285 [Pseudomonadota bacterium]|nr:hypothetical protein [Pseudomonadota bacterium]
MPNYFVSYDLNGKTPTHAQMDKHLEKAGYGRGRILETVWYVKANANLDAVYNYVNSILSVNDRLIVIEAHNAITRNLLISNELLAGAWNK